MHLILGSGLRVITSGYGEWDCLPEADLLQFRSDTYSHEKCASMAIPTRKLPRGIDKQSQFCTGAERDVCPVIMIIFFVFRRKSNDIKTILDDDHIFF